MKCFSTILEALNHHALATPNRVVFTWVNIKCEEQNKMTFKQLEDQSNAVAARLLKLGCQKGDRVMVVYPFGLEFLAGMFGAMKIGVIPCSIYPPNPNKLKTDMPKFRRFSEDAGAKFAMSTSVFAAGMTAAGVLYKTGVKWIGTDKLTIKQQNPNTPQHYETYNGEPEDVCFIQYTSGSTGRPKGVMVRHQNLAENCRTIGTSTQMTSTSVTVSWVPQYHDMGLVGGFMSCLYSCVPLVMTSPLDFLSKPILWSDMIEIYQATHTCAPNFAYALLLKRLKNANRKADWSCLEFAGFSAEPTQQSVVEDVVKTLSVRPGNVHNLYGLAESVVWLTGGPAIPDSEGLVCCGEVDSPTLKLRIVQDGKEVEDGQVGSIWAQSPRVAAGYYGQPELTTSTFANALPNYDGSWLDTGDLGKVVDGQLYVTGRVKDIIIINGRNYYPTDVESSIDGVFGDVVRPGRTAAFQHGEDSVGVTVEGRKEFVKSANEDLAVQISNHVSQMHGLLVSDVVVLKLGVTPKTTSGKLKRNEIKQTTVNGDWKASDVLHRFQLEHNISLQGGTSSDFHLSEGSQDEIVRRSTTLPFGGSVPKLQLHENDFSEPANSDIKASISGAGATDQDDFSIRYANVIMSVFGSHIDTSKSWAENGLTSLRSAELRIKVEEELHVVLPANFEQFYPTPKVLSVHLSASEGKRFPKQNADYSPTPGFIGISSRSRISKLQMGVLQTLGSSVILLLVFVSVVPSYSLVSWVLEKCSSTQGGENHCPVFWICLPLSFPLYFLSLSVAVILCKIAVVGRYRHQQFDLLSCNYIQWWLMDRLMDVWESLVGHFFVNTRFIWIFYWLLGADLAWTAKIESYIREFDLINVGSNATIGHSLKCRKFSYSGTAGGSPKMTFRPIAVGANCTISGMICPGAKIGDGSKVETLSVVEEGAIVPEGVLAQGKPAYNAGSFRHTESIDVEESMLDVFKMLWAIFEAYHLFTLAFVGSNVLHEILPSWRYGGILHWILLLPFTSILALCSSIALKWLLIGKRDPSDEYEGSLYNQATNWACDFHFHAAGFALAPFCGASKIWNIIFFLHGLDIDLESRINGLYAHFQPSKVDFVKIQKSFASAISLDLSKQGGGKIEIINSSVGYNANLHSGIKIMQSTIPPRSDVSESVYDLNQQSSHGLSKPSLIVTLHAELLQVLLNVILFASIIPSYEIGLVATTSSSSGIAALGLGTAFVLQWFVWIQLTRAVEGILFKLPNHIQLSCFGVYINAVWVFRVGNLLEKLLYGTPMFGHYAKLMGAEVTGDLWYFGDELYEYGKLHFKGDVLVDCSHLSGHYVDGKGLTLEDTHVSGVLHPGCYASAGSLVSAAEHGPWKVFLRSDMCVQDSSKLPSDSTSNNV
ncbi:D-alanine--D-alanyl carrier protein ligase [Seminavis robusta]|uniref:D-alanine--D-alanyl carrier protein ligase n=1 Tax=Seminavis robusta TaxID=568900 RepID=A0A9N8EG08_9STRA|nr:D-alanine--D-alanyl carrier protein ligase [Seminavis robusta]|eukprot:Sro1040_g234480.1 D-alanine--D-alanyl carrier protein ligase (1384) ;mRNA; f:23788-28025